MSWLTGQRLTQVWVTYTTGAAQSVVLSIKTVNQTPSVGIPLCTWMHCHLISQLVLATVQAWELVTTTGFGAAGHYKVGPFQFDLAYERNDNIAAEDAIWTNNTYLAGVQAWFDNGISLFAQYKHMEASTDTGVDEKQGSMSSGLMYTTGDWQYKIAYAANFELERDGQTIDNSEDDVVSAQIMYFVDPSAVLYARARFNDFNDGIVGVDGSDRWTSGTNGDFSEYSVGVEYYF